MGPDIDRFDFALEIAEMIGEHRDEGVVGMSLPLLLRRVSGHSSGAHRLACSGLRPNLIAAAPPQKPGSCCSPSGQLTGDRGSPSIMVSSPIRDFRIFAALPHYYKLT
jgi:hypothetical protein